jgi:hypothetical protein
MTPKNPAAVALGRKGGKATARKLTPQQRSDAARKAVEARWAKTQKSLAEMDRNLEALTTRTKKAKKEAT